MASDLRDVVLDALCHFSCPLGQGELDAYARVYHGRAISEPELQALRRSERLAWLAGERRRSWVCAVIGAHDDYPGVDLAAVERFGAWETIAEDAFGSWRDPTGGNVTPPRRSLPPSPLRSSCSVARRPRPTWSARNR